MTPEQSTLFVEERKWDYYGASSRVPHPKCQTDGLRFPVVRAPAFGFAASLLESLPFVGMFFSVSNRIGAAMYVLAAVSAVWPGRFPC